MDNSHTANTNSRSIIDKLQPSSRNRLIGKKFKMLDKTENNDPDLRNWGIEPILNTESTTSLKKDYSLRWNNLVRETKQDALHLDLSTSLVHNNSNKGDFSMISENLEDLNNFIEENYHINITENMFLRQENHSIIPFILLQSKETHRMCLSDYEIKLIYKSLKKKLNTNRINGMDYYKIGLINFYKGKYALALNKFKLALQLSPKETSIIKWYIFSCLVLVFSNRDEKGENYKIDFSNMKDVQINDEKETIRGEDSIFFCCNNRKAKIQNLNLSASDSYNTYTYDNKSNLNKLELCNEIEKHLNTLISSESTALEGW